MTALAKSKPKKARAPAIAQEHGSPWLQQHAKVVVDRELTTAGGARGARVKHECRLDWYWDKMLLDEKQHAAGIRFREDWEIAVVSAGVVGAYEQAISGDAGFTQSQIAARERIRKAITKLGGIATSVITCVCCYDMWAGDWETQRGWPRKSGMALLRDALTDLAKHYGLTGGRETH